ncbi:MAG TPA: hypothetical protein VK968_02750, partial [Roseimicrobium sp.]|nr:hypothetical protein [Roseimicrobium sp.]
QLVTIATPSGTVTDRFALTAGITNIDALTFAAPDVGHGSINFYYVRHDVPTVSTFGQIIVQGASSSADFAPVLPNSGYKALSFAAPDVSTYGANLFYYIREDGAGLASVGTISVAGAMVVTDRYTIGTGLNYDTMVYVPGTVSTWGTSFFAYLRHTTTGSIIGTIDPVTHVATDRLSLGTNLLSSLTFTATDVGYGPNMFYYLLPEQTLVITNSVTNFSTNLVTTIVTNSTTSFTSTNTLTAVGMDVCQSRVVVAAADCLGSVTPPAPAPVMAIFMVPGGSFSTTFLSQAGTVYTIQYKNDLNDPVWTDLQVVTGTGGLMTINDPSAVGLPMRFYRMLISTP